MSNTYKGNGVGESSCYQYHSTKKSTAVPQNWFYRLKEVVALIEFVMAVT